MRTEFDNIIAENASNARVKTRAVVGGLALIGVVAAYAIATKFIVKTACQMINTDNSANKFLTQLKKQQKELSSWFHQLWNQEVDNRTEINKVIRSINEKPVEEPAVETASEEQLVKSAEDKND